MKVLMIGSSIFEQWPSPAGAFPGAQVVNAAIGGTITEDWLGKTRPLLDRHQPDLVCLYCGSNDLNREVPPAQIIENTLAIFEEVQDASCDFAYYPIIKAPQKQDKLEMIDGITGALRATLPRGTMLVDFNPVLCGPDVCIEQLYLEDLLHLTPQAYTEMARLNARVFTRQYGKPLDA